MPPDISYQDFIDYGQTQLRTEIWTEQGSVDAFRVQLEYDMNSESYLPEADPDWCAVARFEHTPNSQTGAHDIREEGLHLDLCANGSTHRKRRNFPPVPVNEAVEYCQDHLLQEHDRLVRLYEKRVEIPVPKRNY